MKPNRKTAGMKIAILLFALLNLQVSYAGTVIAEGPEGDFIDEGGTLVIHQKAAVTDDTLGENSSSSAGRCKPAHPEMTNKDICIHVQTNSLPYPTTLQRMNGPCTSATNTGMELIGKDIAIPTRTDQLTEGSWYSVILGCEITDQPGKWRSSSWHSGIVDLHKTKCETAVQNATITIQSTAGEPGVGKATLEVECNVATSLVVSVKNPPHVAGPEGTDWLLTTEIEGKEIDENSSATLPVKAGTTTWSLKLTEPKEMVTPGTYTGSGTIVIETP